MSEVKTFSITMEQIKNYEFKVNFNLENVEDLLMDEPFSALDALSREEMGFELLRIWREEPKTVLFITHSISEAVLLADKVIVMSPRPGTLVESITIDLPRPRSEATIKLPKFAEYTGRIREHIFHKPASSQTM